MRFLFFVLVASMALTSCNPIRRMTEEELAAQPVSTFILVRHAEKDYGDNPNLIQSGLDRSERLRGMLENVSLDAVYSTYFKRCMQTADPVAAYHGLPIQEYSALELHALAARLKARHRGQTVLVVGHSNTTPELASILDRKNNYPRFSELDYENIYIVTIPPKGAVQVLKLRF